MNLYALLAPLLCSLSLVSASEDILNFTNNDTLHGEFIGFSDAQSLLWESEQSTKKITFKTEQLRKIIFNKGLSRKPFHHSSLLILSNGDSLPCSVSKITETSILVHTDFAGDLTIPKKHVHSCILNPLGQQILYQGPYLAENWDMAAMQNPHPDRIEEPQNPAWEFGSFGWYNRGTMGGISLRDFSLPEAFRLRYTSESPRHSNIALIINADFNSPELPIDEDENRGRINSAERVTSIFGSCIAIKLSSHNATLTCYSVSDNGETTYSNLKPVNGRTSVRRDFDNAKTEVELRVNHPKKVISLYYHEQLVSQWSLKGVDELPKGDGFGFLAHYGGDTYLTRISDISIAPWNGVLDSAPSLTSETQDIVMLSNGKDRFAGTVIQLENQELKLAGNYAEMKIPRNELQSIHFANSSVTPSKAPPKNYALFQFGGSGYLSATPVSSQGTKLSIEHPVLGALTIDFDYLTAIDYHPDISLLDQWNTKIN